MIRLRSTPPKAAQFALFGDAVTITLNPYDPAWEAAARFEVAQRIRKRREELGEDAPVDENFNLGEWEVDVGVAVARRAIASWTGVVGDADEPLPATPDNIEKLLRQIPGAFNEFQTRFGNLNRDYRVEGEASAVSPSGTLDEVQTPAEAA
jgi:hypothetical protein